jgi:hypothetical protein
MSEEIFYKKVGRKYVPVSTYSSEWCDSFPFGVHLVHVYKGGASRRYNVEQDYLAMIAAGRVAEDAISRAIMDATEIRRHSRNKETPLTPGQKAAWENLVKEFGDDAKQLEWPSAREAAEKAVLAMQKEAQIFLDNPAVKKAHDHYILMCKLTQEAAKSTS